MSRWADRVASDAEERWPSHTILEHTAHDAMELGDPPQRRFHMSVLDNGHRQVTVLDIAGRAHVADERTGGTRQPIPIRDCYDICICAALAPNVLSAIFDVLPSAARIRIATNFRTAPRDLHMTDVKPVISPTWSVALEGVAERIGEAVASKDLGCIPVAEKLNPPARNRRRMGDKSPGCQS